MRAMDPIQPYFVLNTKLYRKLIPADSPVAHFYQFTYTEENPVINGVVPDGAIDLILDIQTGAATLSGSVEQAKVSPFLQGHSYFGARIRPGALEHFWEVSSRDLTNVSVLLSDTPDGRAVEERIRSCVSFEQRAALINSIFFDLMDQDGGKKPLQIVQDMLAMIYGSGGIATVHEMEDTLFYSRRHLLRIFQQYIGMDIKRFCGIVRFQSVLSELNGGGRATLAEVAQKYGYYDQAHFQKEFKKYSLLSPKTYRNVILDCGYNDRIMYY